MLKLFKRNKKQVSEMDLEQAEVHAFFYAKVVELGSFKAASKFVQFLEKDGKWTDIKKDYNPIYDFAKYRIKPETVTHPGGEYPKPVSDISDIDGVNSVYMPFFNINTFMPDCGKVEISLFDDEIKLKYAKCGQCHLKKESALEHAKVLFGDRL